MSWLCKFFGHQVYTQKSGGYKMGYQYMEITSILPDGVNRLHGSIYAECARCGKRFHVGMIHIPHDPSHFGEHPKENRNGANS